MKGNGRGNRPPIVREPKMEDKGKKKSVTPEEYIEKLKDAQRTLDMVKEDLDRAMDKMQRRLETGYESLEKESRLAVLAGGEYVRLSEDILSEVALSIIEY